MDLDPLVQWLQYGFPEFIDKHWLKILGSLIGAFLGGSIIWVKNYLEWRSRQFYGTINISFDTIRNQYLLTSAILEGSIENILSNVPHAVKIIKTAAKKTTEDNPFLILPENDRDHIMSQIRACIASTNTTYSWAAAQKRPACRQLGCFFALTYERFKKMRTGKIRIVVVPEWVLKTDLENLKTEYVHHKDRIETLRKIRKDVETQRFQFTRMVRIYTP